MKRRTFLAVAGAGAVGGCLRPSSSQSQDYGTEPVPYEITDLSVSVERVFPTHEHHFDVERRIHDLEGETKDPIKFADLDPELREAIRRIDDRSGNVPVGFDDPPAGFKELVEQHLLASSPLSGDYVELAYYDTDPDADPIADADATVTDDHPELQLTFRNPGDVPIEVESGGPPPFAVLHAIGVGDGDDHFWLWNDAYEAAGVSVSNGYLFASDGEYHMKVEPGETVSRRYYAAAELTDEFVEGTYILSQDGDVENSLYGAPLPVEYYSPALPEREVINPRVEFDLREQ